MYGMTEHGLRGGMAQSTYYPTYNEDELTETLENSVKQILLQMQNFEAPTSNLSFKR